MRRRILLVAAVLLILVGLFILVRVAAGIITPKGKGALQVTTNVKSTVFLNNKPVGSTQLCLCDPNNTLAEGEYELKIVPEDKSIQPFTAKIKINPNVLTAVERTFLPGSLASYSIIILEKTNNKNPQILVASVPDGALVSIDGEESGITPLSLESVSASEHEVEIQKQGFAKKTVRIRAVPSYRLILNVVLGTEGGEAVSTATPTITPKPTETGPLVTIKSTPVGFLRVRQEPSTAAREIGRVNPGESYPLVDENTGWFQIELAGGTRGWISKTYASLE